MKSSFRWKRCAIFSMVVAFALFFTAASAWITSARAESFPAIVVASTMYIRSGPTASAQALGSLSRGTVVTVLEYQDGIAHIEYKGNKGYAQISDMQRLSSNPETGAPTPTPSPTAPERTVTFLTSCTGTVTADTLKVYKSASTSGNVWGTLTRGNAVTVLATDGTWAQLRSGSMIGYALLSGLSLQSKATPSPTPTVHTTSIDPSLYPVAVVTSGRMTVYAEASTDADVLTSLKQGEKVTVLDYTKTWAKLYRSGYIGYALVGNMELISVPAETPTPTPSPTLTVNPYPTMTEALHGTAVVSSTTLKIYRYASDANPDTLLCTMIKGTALNVLNFDDTWAMLERNGVIGYARRSGLKWISENDHPTLTPSMSLPAIVSDSKIYIYKYASSLSEYMGALKKGETIQVLAYDDTWALIERNKDERGYTARSGISLLMPPVTPTPPPTLSPSKSVPAYIALDSTTIYQYATVESEVITTVNQGVAITLLGADSSWALVERAGVRGYCKLSAVTTDDFASAVYETVEATIVASSAKVYTKPFETAAELTTLPLGTSVTITAYTPTWARVTAGGSVGYIYVKYASKTNYEAIRLGSPSADVLKLQKTLENLGYFDGIPAGNYGSLTQAAVKRFQTAIGVSASGTADEITLRVLYGGYAPESPIRSATLQLNDDNDQVTRLQRRLMYKGYFSSSIDGEYGPITQAAVKAYQAIAGLSQDGTAGSATLKSLFASNAPANTGSPISSVGGNGNGGDPNPSDPGPGGSNVGTGTGIELVISTAMAQLGKPYVYATAGPNTFDCSGLTKYCFAKAGVSLSRSAYSVGYTNGKKIEGIQNLKRGDIVCFNTVADSDLSDHVGIYLGSMQFIHASSSKSANKVVISSLSGGYYESAFSWGRRVM